MSALYKFAICDDNSTDCEYIVSLVTKWSESKKIPVKIDTFPSAEAFLFHYAEEKDYDILLLDVEMGEMDGVTMAKVIRRQNETVQIVFITGYSDYIAEGYEVSALHYLMKPVQKEKLFEVLNRACEKVKKNERSLYLEFSGEMIRISFPEIYYLEVQQNYVTIYTKNAGISKNYTIKKPLSELEAKLDDRFFRIGRSCIVNLEYISRITKTNVFLSDATVLPLPRGSYENLNRAIIAHT